MALIHAYRHRGLTKDLTIQDAAGDAITPGVNDKIRAVIGREGLLGSDLATAKLVVTSDAATANGSSFTKGGGTGGSNRLRLDASDLGFAAGIYTMFVDYFDQADAAEWKNVSRQVFNLEETWWQWAICSQHWFWFAVGKG
jgi:hypothetical protein